MQGHGHLVNQQRAIGLLFVTALQERQQRQEPLPRRWPLAV